MPSVKAIRLCSGGALSGCLKALESSGEAVAVGAPDVPPRMLNRASVEALQHLQHRTIVVVEQAACDMNAQMWCDADQVLVERPVMDGAEAQAIAHHRFARLLDVRDDVRRVEEAYLAEPA